MLAPEQSHGSALALQSHAYYHAYLLQKGFHLGCTVSLKTRESAKGRNFAFGDISLASDVRVHKLALCTVLIPLALNPGTGQSDEAF
jgi:hypothetical protein